MTSRRTFLEQSCLLAGSALLAAGAPQASAESDAALLDRAKSLLSQAPLIDTHNDLPSMLLELKAGDLSSIDLSKPQPTLCADIPSMREGRLGVQYWSVFVESSTQV